MKNELYTISERTSDKLIINRKRDRFLFEFGYLTFFLIAWIAALANISNIDDGITERLVPLIKNPFMWIFLLVPIPIAYKALKNLYLLITGDKIEIDKFGKTINKNNKLIINFSDLDYLQIRKYTDSEGDVDYRLSLVKIDGEKIFIDRVSDKNGIIKFAEEIGDFTNKEIKFK